MSETTILAVDPGKASGISVVWWSGLDSDGPKKMFSAEVQPEHFADTIKPWLDDWSSTRAGIFVVACERFVINAQTVRNSQAPYSLEQIGVLKHLCRESGYPVDNIMMQAPVDAKRMFPNDVLRALDVWHRGGEGHANDSLRHALLALVRAKWSGKQILEKN